MLNIMRRAFRITETDHDEVHMEARIARLESDVEHIKTDVADMKSDIRDLRDRTNALRDRMEAGFAEVRQSIAQLSAATEKAHGQLSVALEKSHGQLSAAMERGYGKLRVATIETRVWALVTVGGILFLMARALKWI